MALAMAETRLITIIPTVVVFFPTDWAMRNGQYPVTTAESGCYGDCNRVFTRVAYFFSRCENGDVSGFVCVEPGCRRAFRFVVGRHAVIPSKRLLARLVTDAAVAVAAAVGSVY